MIIRHTVKSVPDAETILGVGMGLRSAHYQYIESMQPDIPWFEALVDNYLGKGGSAITHLQRIRRDYPLTFHGVGMSLGSTDELDRKYLAQLREAIQQYEPAWVSEHLSWSGIAGEYAHDLLPLPYTEECIQHLVDRISTVQDFLGQQILIENVSSYLLYKQSFIPEWEFINAVAARADCLILLDINNVYVSASNHGYDAQRYLDCIDRHRVRELHLAGYEDQGEYLLDTHGEEVHPPVWKLYRKALKRFGKIPTLIEWDNNIPDFERVCAEVHKAESIMNDTEYAVA